MQIYCLALMVLALLMPTAFAARVALVIGNGAYKDSPLKNPANDARDMSAKLKELGFTVIAKENLKRREITPTLRQFRSQIKPGDEVLFFYAGHGVQVKGVNYLPTVDAQIDSEDDVPLESINVSSVLELLDESKAAVKLVFLDACRNNPYARSFRSADRGLSRVGNVAPSGTLISFATKPGSVAADGNGRNGLYTEQLLKYMGNENTQVEQVLKNVIRDVKKGSNGAQEPWSEGSLDGDFYFRKGAQVASLSPAFVASPAVLPGSAGVDFADLEKAQRNEVGARKQWVDWQKRMQVDFDKAAKYTGSVALVAWIRFLNKYESDNPYSSDDELLRSQAQKRKTYFSSIKSTVPIKFVTTSLEDFIQRSGLTWVHSKVYSRNGVSGNGLATWEEANMYCNSTAIANSSDWRLPTKDELVNFYKLDSGILKTNWMRNLVWSSTPSGAGVHYYVNMDDGKVYIARDADSTGVTCVR